MEENATADSENSTSQTSQNTQEDNPPERKVLQVALNALNTIVIDYEPFYFSI